MQKLETWVGDGHTAQEGPMWDSGTPPPLLSHPFAD